MLPTLNSFLLRGILTCALSSSSNVWGEEELWTLRMSRIVGCYLGLPSIGRWRDWEIFILRSSKPLSKQSLNTLKLQKIPEYCLARIFESQQWSLSYILCTVFEQGSRSPCVICEICHLGQKAKKRRTIASCSNHLAGCNMLTGTECTLGLSHLPSRQWFVQKLVTSPKKRGKRANGGEGLGVAFVQFSPLDFL